MFVSAVNMFLSGWPMRIVVLEVHTTAAANGGGMLEEWPDICEVCL